MASIAFPKRERKENRLCPGLSRPAGPAMP
jgi:hypothetical protein